jgi:hypothetical protein
MTNKLQELKRVRDKYINLTLGGRTLEIFEALVEAIVEIDRLKRAQLRMADANEEECGTLHEVITEREAEIERLREEYSEVVGYAQTVNATLAKWEDLLDEVGVLDQVDENNPECLAQMKRDSDALEKLFDIWWKEFQHQHDLYNWMVPPDELKEDYRETFESGSTAKEAFRDEAEALA